MTAYELSAMIARTRGYSPREIMIASMYFEGDEGNLIPLLKSIRKGDEIQ